MINGNEREHTLPLRHGISVSDAVQSPIFSVVAVTAEIGFIPAFSSLQRVSTTFTLLISDKAREVFSRTANVNRIRR